MGSYFWEKFTHELFTRLPGCQLLPDDIKFLYNRLPRIPRQRREILQRYWEEWMQGMDNEPVDHKKQNQGRFRANTWIRSLSSRSRDT